LENENPKLVNEEEELERNPNMVISCGVIIILCIWLIHHLFDNMWISQWYEIYILWKKWYIYWMYKILSWSGGYT